MFFNYICIPDFGGSNLQCVISTCIKIQQYKCLKTCYWPFLSWHVVVWGLIMALLASLTLMSRCDLNNACMVKCSVGNLHLLKYFVPEFEIQFWELQILLNFSLKMSYCRSFRHKHLNKIGTDYSRRLLETNTALNIIIDVLRIHHKA